MENNTIVFINYRLSEALRLNPYSKLINLILHQYLKPIYRKYVKNIIFEEKFAKSLSSF
jgi:hypothetical protein